MSERPLLVSLFFSMRMISFIVTSFSLFLKITSFMVIYFLCSKDLLSRYLCLEKFTSLWSSLFVFERPFSTVTSVLCSKYLLHGRLFFVFEIPSLWWSPLFCARKTDSFMVTSFHAQILIPDVLYLMRCNFL